MLIILMQAAEAEYIHQNTQQGYHPALHNTLFGRLTSLKKVSHHVTQTQYHVLPSLEKTVEWIAKSSTRSLKVV
jgi:hypothetical protein